MLENETEEDKIDQETDEHGPEEEMTLSVDKVIESFIHRVLDIEDCAEKFISLAIEQYKENSDRLKSEMENCIQLLEADEQHEQHQIGVRKFRQWDREVKRHYNSQPVEVLEKSLFISLFSAFDKYIGDLVTVLYSLNPELYKNINREVQLSEALTYSSIEEFREKMLDKEIEAIRRKSYKDQFSDLEKRFSMNLTKFDDWSTFIEMSQRRNLFTHCDGIVSKQYLDVCKSVDYKFDSVPKIGDQLDIGNKYFFQSCYVIAEVAVMLGQTLWRKTMPEQTSDADSSLNSLIFDFLHMEDWKKSISLCRFSQKLPQISNDEMERLLSVNYAIALKAIGNKKAAKNILDKKDWSATTYDFRLAYSVICEDYEESGKIMQRIGKEGELVNEMAYHDWPLFREFRERPEFFDNYESVYGYKYCSKLSSIAGEHNTEVAELECQ